MANAKAKISLATSRDIPFQQLQLSQANVRRVKAGVSIEELADDIVRRGLLQGLSVRAVVDADGNPTDMFEIPAGGRRYRALELLVKQKRLAKTAPVPCIVREGGIAEEDSLAENVQRAPLHPLDQFRAFLALREKGQSEEEIAAAFFVPVSVVKQRLKLASVSPRLLAIYAEDGIALDQLMAFTVSGDHERQEQVFERISQGYDKQPYAIRRMLTENAIRAADRRAQFIGVDAYVESGGTILRDLFQGDEGGWLQDVQLVDLMVAEKLNEAAVTVGQEGWKWIEAASDLPYGHNYGLRHLRGEQVPMTPEEEAERLACQALFDKLNEQYADHDELPDEIDEQLGELESRLDRIDARPIRFDPDEVARAGAFISIASDGELRIERGYVRPEDELPAVASDEAAGADDTGATDATDVADPHADSAGEPLDREEDDALAPMSDRLISELTAHRTLGLRHLLGDRPDIAFLAALHALTLRTFYHYGSDSCLELELKSVTFGPQAPGLNDSVSADAIRTRHDAWAEALPRDSNGLWDVLQTWDGDSRSALFAHVVSQSVNAVQEPWNKRPRALAHADLLAQSVDLDMAALGWKPTVDSFFGRVTKARIREAVTEAKGIVAADRMAHLKKGEMAAEAEALLADSHWLPVILRTRGTVRDAATSDTGGIEPACAETAAIDGEPAMADDDTLAEDPADDMPHAIAAE
ncbi:ParB/RepB/Spo0J family partition protein [Sandaracinobacter neustonicus]|uniref:ParB/RepB/Spo0J family partition protein n=1 Tax=Sandaracinobacter neustonicus TaxID=1715348 RepID=A0A501XXR3_9SPHN|nr:ParB/RepB/Spo0J family partition protein [Sandaracinobacter neustonicus]TPE64847.1 ParB/RepB/Spo0J family partition protein [Sandaracinobacter neustonicus]